VYILELSREKFIRGIEEEEVAKEESSGTFYSFFYKFKKKSRFN
jgi:hypothetical protein